MHASVNKLELVGPVTLCATAGRGTHNISDDARRHEIENGKPFGVWPRRTKSIATLRNCCKIPEAEVGDAQRCPADHPMGMSAHEMT